MTGVSWASGSTYTLYFRARDSAGNYQVGWSTRTFSYDNEPPLSAISVPLDGAQIKDASELPSLTWTQTDPGFSGINQVLIKIRRNTDGACWRIGGSGWNTTAPVVAACAVGSDSSGYYATWVGGAQSQSTFLLNADLTEGTSYQVMVRAQDNATNWETAIETVTVHFDGLKPVATPVYPAGDLRVNSLPTISGTVTDPSPTQPPPGKIVKVEVQIERGVDGFRWNGSAWAGGDLWRTSWESPASGPPTGGTFTWTYPNGVFADVLLGSNLANGETYRFRGRATDSAGNIQNVFFTNTFIFDNQPPSSSVTAPGATPINSISHRSGHGVRRVSGHP